MSIKSYKVNNTWGINCITNNDGSMGLEVVMISVPWQEIVESEYNIKDKDVANVKFKELVNKYRQLGEAEFLRR